MGTRTSSPSCRRRPPNSHSLTSRSSPRVKLSHRLGTSADSTFQSEFPISDSSHSHAWSRQYDHVLYFTVQYITVLCQYVPAGPSTVHGVLSDCLRSPSKGTGHSCH